MDQKLNYSLTPYYSTGTNSMTGSGSILYSVRPADKFYRSWDFGVGGSYFHYDFDLSYQKFSAFTTLNFVKEPRSTINKNLGISYSFNFMD